MDLNSVLLDTCFLIKLLDEKDPMHKNVLGYYDYFTREGIALKVSTITIAEYCVKGQMDELPMSNLQIVPFNLQHAERAGKLAQMLFKHRAAMPESVRRIVIPNDTKLLAQADSEGEILWFATADNPCMAIYNTLKSLTKLQFQIRDISIPYGQAFGLLL